MTTDLRHTPWVEMKFITVDGEVVPLIWSALDGLYRDDQGTIYAFADSASQLDVVSRCGVGILSLPKDSALTAACGPHDFSYSSPAYQLFHTRADADAYLEDLVRQVRPGILGAFIGRWFRIAAGLFGGLLWENRKTR